jgi:serine/threonine-protein kinase RIO1
VYEGEPWFIDLSEAIRVDRIGSSAWRRMEEARKALSSGLSALSRYFAKYDLHVDVEGLTQDIVGSLEKFEVLGSPGP